jgi:hypothetical protein
MASGEWAAVKWPLPDIRVAIPPRFTGCSSGWSNHNPGFMFSGECCIFLFPFSLLRGCSDDDSVVPHIVCIQLVGQQPPLGGVKRSRTDCASIRSWRKLPVSSGNMAAYVLGGIAVHPQMARTVHRRCFITSRLYRHWDSASGLGRACQEPDAVFIDTE